MKLKQKLLLALVASILVTPTAFADYNAGAGANTGTTDDALDLHTVTVKVPEVALLDVQDTTDVEFECKVGTQAGSGATLTGEAGTGFTCAKADTKEDKVIYDITANIKAYDASPKVRQLTVSADADIESTWKLTATPTAPDATSTGGGTEYDLQNSNTTPVVLLGNIRNVVANDKNIQYALVQRDAAVAMAYSDASDATKAIVLTYTLSDDTI